MRLHKTPVLFALALWLLLLQVDSLSGYEFRWCSYFYHFSKEAKDCVKCTDKCPRGTGLNKNCGYDYYGNKYQPACSVCPPGFFSKNGRKRSATKLSMPCRRCKSCQPPQNTIRHCTSKRNTKCRQCPIGYYKHSDGKCYKCSYCCDGMLKTGLNVVNACLSAGMGRCSCKENTVCLQKNGNALCLAIRAVLGQNNVK